MAAREFLTNLSIILAVMALLSLFELAVPLFARSARSKGRGFANFGLTLFTFLVNWGLISAAAGIALVLSFQGGGLLAPLALPMPALVAITIVTLDLATYLAHLSMHKIPLLWRVHSVHHSDPFLDVGTTFRQHPIEGLWRFLWIIVPVSILGLPAAGVVIYRLLSAVNAALEHANVRVWGPLDRALSLVWTTPNMHKIHHSRKKVQNDSNYGNLLSLYDRGFRTFTPTDRAFGVVYGLDDVESKRSKSLSGLMTLPFARASE